MNFILLTLIGLGIGWLLGLSVTPVVQTVVSSIIAITVSIVTAISGLNKEKVIEEGNKKEIVRSNYSALPLSGVMLGIIIGSIFGILARNNDWLGIDPNNFVNRWKGTGLADTTLQRQLLYSHFNKDTKAPTNSSVDLLATRTVLFSTSAEECNQYSGLEGEALRRQLASSSDTTLRKLVTVCKDDQCLKLFVTQILCKK